MMDTSLTRSMLLALVVLVHGVIFWWLLSPLNNTTPPIAPAIIVAMLLPAPGEAMQAPSPAPKPVPPTTPPRKQSPQTAAPATKPVPLSEPQPTEPAPPREPEQKTVAPPAPAQPAPFVPAPPTVPPVPAIAAPPTPPAPVLPPRFDAAYLNNPAPAYPLGARRMGVQGKVLLRVHVSAEGAATEVQLHKSSGFPALDEAALAAVRKWRFAPARQGSEAVAAWVQVPIDFKLN